MRHWTRFGLALALVVALVALAAAGAAAQTGSGPRETVDQSFTTTRPGAPTGGRYSARYHAAGNKSKPPPYLRRMIFFPPPGMRYDTSVPARCNATDAQLELQGPSACPLESVLGGGTAEGLFLVPFAHGILFDHYRHHVDVVNAAHQQIVLVHSEGYTVVRGQVRPDSSIDYKLPTCFPYPPTGCVDEYINQLASSSNLPKYTRASGGRVRSYATTPPRCPASGYWRSIIRFFWKNGAVDDVVTRQPCRSA